MLTEPKEPIFIHLLLAALAALLLVHSVWRLMV